MAWPLLVIAHLLFLIDAVCRVVLKQEPGKKSAKKKMPSLEILAVGVLSLSVGWASGATLPRRQENGTACVQLATRFPERVFVPGSANYTLQANGECNFLCMCLNIIFGFCPFGAMIGRICTSALYGLSRRSSAVASEARKLQTMLRLTNALHDPNR